MSKTERIEAIIAEYQSLLGQAEQSIGFQKQNKAACDTHFYIATEHKTVEDFRQDCRTYCDNMIVEAKLEADRIKQEISRYLDMLDDDERDIRAHEKEMALIALRGKELEVEAKATETNALDDMIKRASE